LNRTSLPASIIRSVHLAFILIADSGMATDNSKERFDCPHLWLSTLTHTSLEGSWFRSICMLWT
jgi:hypothetical protein